MRRVVLALLAVSLLAAPAALAQDAPPPPPPPVHGEPPPQAPPATQPSPGPPSWAQPQIRAVVAAGLMAPSVAAFRPNDVLTRGELAELLRSLGGAGTGGGDPGTPVRVSQLDAALVRVLGLADEAAALRRALAGAGLAPPARAGTEVVARLLGLRLNHPEAQDPLELGPSAPITRAEVAYSVAAVLALRGSRNAQALAAPAASLALPELTDWQRRVLARAIRFVGYPYVWGGTSEKPQAPFGVRVPGGFDCSGLAWRVYKLEPFDGAPQLAATLVGRTTYVMSGEVPASKRIPRDALEPADLLFFGDAGPASKPSQVGHMGIYVGGGWFLHSSSRGVTMVPLAGWYADRFAWARRPLAEAGLE
jgi:cell wall-associated NlpC family hydrolase